MLIATSENRDKTKKQIFQHKFSRNRGIEPDLNTRDKQAQ